MLEEHMATKKKAKTKKVPTRKKKKGPVTSAKKGAASDVPNLFRLNVEVGNLDQAAEFYGKLFGLEGRKQAGSRCYFNCGPVTLQVVDVSSVGKPHPAAKALYFMVKDLDAVFARAKALGCLSREDVHGVSAGNISVRPWGERSFYAEDKWQNPLCFVEAGTIYPG
jgi:predicted enzyme related to lactoylglutathione lyase